MFKRISAMGLAAALGAGVLVAGGAVPVQAKTVNACVKKSTGEVRILTKKKCKKGWKQVSWNQKGKTGPQGAAGAPGPNLAVKDATGKVLGKFLGIFPQMLPLISVEIDGGAYLYFPNGQLSSGFMSGSPNYKTATCTGSAFVAASSPVTLQLLTGSAGGVARVVYRKTTPVYGPPLAWEFTATTQDVVAQQLYRLDAGGACAADGPPFSGTLITLSPVPAPPDYAGPLTIG